MATAAKPKAPGMLDKLKNLGSLAESMQSNEGGELAFVDLDLIDIEPQQRFETFDGTDSTIESLAGTIDEQGGLLQTILLCPKPNGRYRLVAGERRVRALRKLGKTTAPALIRHMTETQIADAQFLENVERQKLSALETTKAIERRIATLRESGVAKGEITARILKAYGRENNASNQTWLSNLMALKDLGEAGKEALGLTNSMQAVAAVARLEKQDPAKAAGVVASVKEAAKTNPRGASAALVEKASKEKAALRAASGKAPRANGKKTTPKAANGTSTATPPDDSHKQPGVGVVSLPGLANGLAVTHGNNPHFVDGDEPEFGVGNDDGAGEGADAANSAANNDEAAEEYANIETRAVARKPDHPAIPLLNTIIEDVQAGAEPKDAIAMLAKADADHVRDFLSVFFDGGKKSRNPITTVLAGLRRGYFAADGIPALQLAAFLQGTEGVPPRFHLVNLIGSMCKTRIELNP